MVYSYNDGPRHLNYCGVELHGFAQARVIYFVVAKGLSVNGTTFECAQGPPTEKFL